MTSKPRRKGRPAMDWSNSSFLGPILVAVITAVSSIVGGQALAGWFARRQQKADAVRQREQGDTAAKMTTDQAERALLSANLWKFVGELQGQIETLNKSHDEVRKQLSGLSDELDTVRRANTALRVENDQLKERLSGESERRTLLEKKVDQLDSERILMARELARLGVIWKRRYADGTTP